MYRYIQELLQNMYRESSRSKVKLKKGKSAGSSFQGPKKKASVKPEVLASIGSKRREIEHSSDFMQLKHTYDLLMKRFSNQTLERSLPSLKLVQHIKKQDIEREIQNLFLPHIFYGKQTKDAPMLQELPSLKEFKKAAEILSIGWSGQVTRSFSQPQVEVAKYPWDITSALLLYPEIEDNFKETDNQHNKQKKRRSQKRSFTARKIKLFNDKNLLRRFEKPSFNIQKMCEDNLYEPKTKTEEKHCSSEHNLFNHVPYDFSKESDSPKDMKLSADILGFPEKWNATENENNKIPLTKKVSNPFISFAAMIKEFYYKQAEQADRSDNCETSLFKSDKEKDNSINIQNKEAPETSTGCSSNALGDTGVTKNPANLSEISTLTKESKEYDKISKETSNPKLCYSNDTKIEANVLNFFTLNPTDPPEEKGLSPSFENRKSPTSLTISNDKVQKSTKKVISIENEVNYKTVGLSNKSLEGCVDVSTSNPSDVKNQSHTKKSNLSLGGKLISSDTKKPGPLDSDNRLDDLNNKYKVHLNSILNRTKTLETQVEQENLVCTKLNGLSSFKCSIKNKTTTVQQTNCEKQDDLTSKPSNTKMLQKNECINMNNLLEQGETQHINYSKMNNVTDTKTQDENKQVGKTNIRVAEDSTKQRDVEVKNVYLKSTIPSQEMKSPGSLKSFTKGQKRSQLFNCVPQPMENKQFSINHYNGVKNKSASIPKAGNSTNNKNIGKVLKNQASLDNYEKSDHSKIKLLSNNEQSQSMRIKPRRLSSYRVEVANSIPLENPNTMLNLFSNQSGYTNNIFTQNIKNISDEWFMSLKSSKSKRQLNLEVGGNSAHFCLNEGVSEKETSNKNVIYKTNTAKTPSLTNCNANKDKNVYDKVRPNKSVEEFVPQNSKTRTETFVSKPLQTVHSANNLHRKHTKNDLKALQVILSLKKYGEEKKGTGTALTNIKSLRSVNIVKKQMKCHTKSSNKISFDRLSLREKRGGVNCNFLMQNRSFSTEKQSYQLGNKSLINDSKKVPNNHTNEKSKVSFKTKSKLEKYKTNVKPKRKYQNQLNKKDSSVQILFSRQEQKDKLANENNLNKVTTKGFNSKKYKKQSSSVYSNTKPTAISKDVSQTLFNVGGPLVDIRLKWKSKEDRIVSWKLILGKSPEPMISKLRTVIKTHSLQTIFNLKKQNDLAPNSTMKPQTNSKNLGQTRLIQKLDSVIKKEMEYRNADIFKLNQPRLSKKHKTSDTNKTKTVSKKEIDKLDLNLYFNTNKINRQNELLPLGSKMYDNFKKSILPVKENKLSSINSKITQTNKSSSKQNMKPLSYETETVQNKLCDDGSWLFKNNSNLNLLAKRHSSSLILNNLLPISKEENPKTSTLSGKTESLTNYRFDPDTFTSMKQPKVQVKQEAKTIETEQPKYETKKESETLKPHNFVPSSKLKELLKINIDVKNKHVLSGTENPTSTTKSIKNIEYFKKSAELLPIDTMVKLITDQKISLPALNSKTVSVGKIKTEKLQAFAKAKMSLTTADNRQNKNRRKRSQKKTNSSRGNKRKTSLPLTNVKKLNNIRKSKSEVTFTPKLENSPTIYKHLENQFTNFNKRYFVKPTTESLLAVSQDKLTKNNNTKGKEKEGFVVTAPSKTSTNKQSNSGSNSQCIRQYKLFHDNNRPSSKIWESKKSSESVLLVNKKQASINKTHLVRNYGMVKSRTQIAQHGNILQNKNQEKEFATGKATGKWPNKPIKNVSQSSKFEICDKNLNAANKRLTLSSLERERLLNKVTLINDFKSLLEKQIKQRKQLTGNNNVVLGSTPNLFDTVCNDKPGMKEVMNTEYYKDRHISCISCSLKKNAKPETKTTEKSKSSLFGLNRKSWDLSDEFESCII